MLGRDQDFTTRRRARCSAGSRASTTRAACAQRSTGCATRRLRSAARMPGEVADEGNAPAGGEQVRVPLARIAREWTRIGFTGFGGPPAHIALLRQLVVEREGWMDARSFQDANAACGLLPGPASTQLAIYCAFRLGGPLGALCRRARLHRARGRPRPAAVTRLPRALDAAVGPRRRCRRRRRRRGRRGPGGARAARPELRAHARESRARARWGLYIAVNIAAAALIGPYLVLVLLACGLIELLAQRRPSAASSFSPIGRYSPPLPRAAGSHHSPGPRSRSARSRSAGAS